MMKTMGTLDLSADRRVEDLSGRSDPVDDGSLEPFRIISAGPIYTLLYLQDK